MAYFCRISNSEFDHLGIVPVASVLTEPEHYVGETLADPLEGAAYGRAKAKVMKANDGGLLIHSFAHGRGLYQLRHDARSAKAGILKPRQTPRSIMPWRSGDDGPGGR